MFPTNDHPLAGVRLTIQEAAFKSGNAWGCSVERLHRGGAWGTLHHGLYHGVMTDVMPEWASDLVSTFLYGPGGEALFKDARGTLKTARAHQKTWEESRGLVEF